MYPRHVHVNKLATMRVDVECRMLSNYAVIVLSPRAYHCADVAGDHHVSLQIIIGYYQSVCYLYY